MKLWDSEGNEFTIIGSVKDGLTLRGDAGDKEISIHDLKFYRARSPETWEAMEAIHKAIMSGDLTIAELRKIMGKNK
jgi:hypothetical protein